MKVVLIRHIKSDWSNSVSDFDRPIRNDRKTDAKRISDALKAIGIAPEKIIASPAKRTRQTALLFANAFHYSSSNIEYAAPLYESTSEELFAFIQGLDKAFTCVFIICHNPSVTDFINSYTNGKIDHVPTCGCAVLDAVDDKFSICGFYYPKK